ncbi:MAG: zinc-binding alcohol dehydrogenase [Clostridiales bacterium]|nr:zinc-binding alcohol dehydrogenase [Clostridiales bacterium]
MDKRMKKIVITGPRQVEIQEVPIPEPGEQTLLVKTELSGVSAGTEMMLYRGTYPNFTEQKWPQWREYPVMPGYELVGTVVAVGPGGAQGAGGGTQMDSLGPASSVIRTDVGEFKVGDRVICLGEHAEYALVPAVLAAKIPENVSSEEATLAVLATTAIHCVHRAEIRYGDTVAVVGCGVLGYLVMQHLKRGGARKVIVLDMNDERLAVAKQTGADAVVNPGRGNAVEALRAANGGILADVVVEASGFPGAAQQAMELARDRGRVVLLGWHTEGVHFDFGEFYFHELTVVASQAIGPEAGLPYSYVRWTSDQSLKWAIELIADGKLTGKYFKPTRFHFSEIEKVYRMIDRRDPAAGLQTVLTWD